MGLASAPDERAPGAARVAPREAPRLLCVAVAGVAAGLACIGCAARNTALTLDNDQFSDGADEDRDYTQGTFFEQRLPDPRAGDNAGANFVAGVLGPLGFLERWLVPEAALDTRDLSFRLEQRLYSPADIFDELPVLTERPYSAQLGLFFQSRRVALDADPARRRDRLGRLALGVGSTGDPALGEPAQRWTHAVLSEPDPVGWENEQPGEPFVQLELERRDRWLHADVGALELEALTTAELELGNLRTRALAELELRLGRGLPRALRPWDGPGSPELSWFASAAFGGRAVAHDISIEGSLFREDWPLEPEPLIAAWRFGLFFERNGFTVGYQFMRAEKEYASEPGLHDVGRVLLGYAFRF